MPPELPDLKNVRHVHLIAIAGTAMGSLACLLAERGMRVTGSDSAGIYPPMSDQLRDAGIAVQLGFAEAHVRDPAPDLVVIGNAVRRENPEAQAVLSAGIPYLSQADALKLMFLRGKHSVVVAGTHGKTTCTSLIAWILTHSRRDPGVFVGGVAENFRKSFRLGNGAHFVVEGDEYDTAFFDKTPKFLHYEPRSVLFTSCEFDHADIYDSLAQIEEAFRSLMRIVPSDGRVLACADAPLVLEVARASSAPVESYGFAEHAQWQARNLTSDAHGSSFEVWRSGTQLGRLEIPMHGRYNVQNVLGCTALCHGLGVSLDETAAALRSFAGVRRRQQVHGEASGMAVIEDFAHHPTAVRETLGAIRARYPGRVLWAVFEPRTNTSRRRVFEDDYIEALAEADRVVLAQVHGADKLTDEQRMRPERIVEALRARGVEATYSPGVDEIIEQLLKQRTGNDAALIMSNGDFGGIWKRLLGRLQELERN